MSAGTRLRGGAPRPGTSVRGSRTGRPIMALFDLLGRRWSMRLLWEMRDGSVTFRELQARCDGMSSSVLNERLRELREAGIVTSGGRSGYTLSDDGESLLEALAPLHAWAERWGERAR